MLRRFSRAAFVGLLAGFVSGAQAPSILWEARFGGEVLDGGKCVVECSDGGFVITGSTSSSGAGDEDMLLVKTDARGQVLWQKTYGGAGYDDGRAVVQTADGGFAICGKTESFRQDGAFDEYADVYVVRTDARGEAVWERTYGSLDYDWGASILEEPDGGFVVAGTNGPRGRIMKLDASGNPLWDRVLGDDVTLAYSVDRAPDGGYIIGGIANVEGRNLDLLLLKTDGEGNVVWRKTYGGPYRDEFGVARATSDGEYVLTGAAITTAAAGSDLWIVKTDADGEVVWINAFGGPAQDYGFAVRELSDGGFVAAGFRDSGTPNPQAYVVATDAEGALVWELAFGGATYEGLFSLAEVSCGGFVAAGEVETGDAHREVYLVRLGTFVAPLTMIRGDASVDGRLDIADAVNVLAYLFTGGKILCRDACDANDDGRLDLSDAIAILLHLFGGGPLPEPSSTCGFDPTDDALDCEAYSCD